MPTKYWKDEKCLLGENYGQIKANKVKLDQIEIRTSWDYNL